MKRWEAGYLMCVAAGLSLLISAALPWAQVGDPPATFYALQLRLYFPLALAILTGVGLIVFGFMRTMWAGLVGIVAAFVCTLMIVTIHGDIYSGLRIAAPTLALGETVHVTGYGVSVMFAAGMLAGLGGFIAAMQGAPKVVT